jgi:hypothetical protein
LRNSRSQEVCAEVTQKEMIGEEAVALGLLDVW